MIGKVLRTMVPARYRPSRYIENIVRRRTNGCVASGPFVGMLYEQGASGRLHIAKALGIYERELAPYIERASAQNFPLIVDVGAAEGYYAVGMALRNPPAKVIAFEMNPKTRRALAEAVTLNKVQDRVEIRGKCEPGELESSLSKVSNPLLICDVEGYEAVLLDPVAVPSLQKTSVLVELHEFVEKGVTNEIRQRFAVTHAIDHVLQQERRIHDFPFVDLYTRCLPRSYLLWAVGESRPELMSWFWMEPKF